MGPRLPVGARGWRRVAVNARKGGFDDNAKPRASPSVMKQMIASWSMVMVHGLMVAGPSILPRLHKIVGSQVRRGAGAFGNRKSNVVGVQAGYLARPAPEAPETQIYFTTHRSGAFPALRQRTVVRGERASRSIVNRTTALWSIWIVSSLILAGVEVLPIFDQTRGREVAVPRGSSGAPNIDRQLY